MTTAEKDPLDARKDFEGLVERVRGNHRSHIESKRKPVNCPHIQAEGVSVHSRSGALSAEINASVVDARMVVARSIIYRRMQLIKYRENSILLLFLIAVLFLGLGFALHVFWIAAAVFIVMCLGAIGGVVS